MLSGVWKAWSLALAQPPPRVFLWTLDNPSTSLGFNFLFCNETLIPALTGIPGLAEVMIY